MVDTVKFSMVSTVSFMVGKPSFWVPTVLGSRRCFESWQEYLNHLLDWYSCLIPRDWCRPRGRRSHSCPRMYHRSPDSVSLNRWPIPAGWRACRVGMRKGEPWRCWRVSRLSGGQLRRVGLAQALVANPQVLLLDEPTAGLDPAQRHSFREVLKSVPSGDQVVVVSTHMVDDIEELY